MRDYLSSSRVFLLNKAEPESCTFFQWNISTLQAMNKGKLAIEERLQAYRNSGNIQWMIECFLISLVQGDAIVMGELLREYKIANLNSQGNIRSRACAMYCKQRLGF